MAHISDLIETDIEAYLDKHEHKTLLRFITCGSVDDGKSTLIGRLLYESKMVFEDQLASLTVDSKRVGTQGADLDFALLVDGLAAEREQGITIDVAYRFFSTENRKFIVADTPGHEQYTRNMVTGASTADLAIILVDAQQGLLTQTRRHSYLVSLLGIPRVVLAINKLDAVGYNERVARSIESDYREFAESIGLDDVTVIPISALKGDNVTTSSVNMPWYSGPTLMDHLETVPVDEISQTGPFRLPVQLVARPDQEFRGYAGPVVGGTIRPGDPIVALPSGLTSTVERIVTLDGDLDEAVAGQSVTLTLSDEIDISRGDVLCSPESPAHVASLFETNLVWMSEEPMLPGRPYLIKIGTRTVPASIERPKYKVNVNTLEHQPADTLELNEIGVCNLSTSHPIVFDSYLENRDTGGFIVIDRITNATVGAGMINFSLRRSDNVQWQAITVDKAAHALMKGQQPCVVWFTGISGAGKSTLANLVEKQLHAQGRHTYLLDGDNVRHGLNKDLGFTAADRVENIRRVAEVANLMVQAGLIVLVSFISPFESERRMAREMMEPSEFYEIFVDTPLAVAEERDLKGLYAKARAGELKNFTGIDSPYEPPEHPDLRIDTTMTSLEEAADQVVAGLRSLGVLHPHLGS